MYLLQACWREPQEAYWMSLLQAFQVKSLDNQQEPRMCLLRMSLGSVDYDTWQIYFRLCLEKILIKKKSSCITMVSKTFSFNKPTEHKRHSKL